MGNVESFVIGTAEGCEVCIHDQYASNRHARVTKDDDGRIWIEDLGSTNGTWLNGSRVYGKRLMQVGDVVRIGRTEIPWNEG